MVADHQKEEEYKEVQIWQDIQNQFVNYVEEKE